MKHLKTYENNLSHQYKIGDYIMIKRYNPHTFQIILVPVKIMDVGENVSYLCCLSATNRTSWISEFIIVRKLTEEEINEYELELDANKYNL